MLLLARPGGIASGCFASSGESLILFGAALALAFTFALVLRAMVAVGEVEEEEDDLACW